MQWSIEFIKIQKHSHVFKNQHQRKLLSQSDIMVEKFITH